MFDCVGIGICAVDYLCLLSHYPELDEKLDITQFSFQGGGPVPTAMVTLSRLGAKTSYIGVIGDDNNGNFLLEQFAKEGVDTSAIIIDKNSSTNQAFIWIDNISGKKTIALNNNRIKKLLSTDLSKNLITSTRFLHVDGRETEPTLVAINCAKKSGAKVVLDAGSPRKNMKQILKLVDYPIVSENFCNIYLKTTNFDEGLEKLLKTGAKAAVITCGEKGCYGVENNSEVIYQPAYNVEVVDTTGAGDVFHGAFIFGLIQNWGLAENLRFAAATAAIKCTQLGGQVGIPNLNSVRELLNIHS